MKIDKDQITKVSRLARLELTEEEKLEFSRQLSDIIEYVEKIKELDTASIEPADHIVELKNVFRSDTVGPSLPVSELEKIAPSFENGHIVVPKIIEGS
ncbi:MAG: Asp-tRNA(Asn)/Glu-tRNA(Gln) amidotransferase GatCAB subunit C [Spirochaetae bacterium HGW-Spirochaetae-1]|jgi:aspartyl-tRNA(Asn)/glutamyl-tRNA(Gln) amidotransferase subunit C|nr:MAG: Asp-tRNA(Asn)/Glu-tRNA(Gln) amidotransferase GatCAB subunit C [Spirochaetae bacterium HGW-Spirochaetae-1]